jgi:hypothetical protein
MHTSSLHPLAFLASLILATTGCASAPAAKPASSAQADAPSGVPECDRFASALCLEVGEDTEPCTAMRSMRAWLPSEACSAAAADMSGVQARIQELRASCVTLGQRLCAELGEDTEECQSVKQDMPRVPAGHCKVLLSHYPELVQQLKDRATRSKPMDAAVWQALMAGEGPSFG